MPRIFIAFVIVGTLVQTAAANPFDQCAACHSVDGTNGTGPTLKGVFGRQAGTVSGFRYSRAMRGAAVTWDAKSLDQYLSDPQGFIAGNIMPFSGVDDAAERAAIVAYLQSLL
jgi:cytochrome c